MLQVQSGSSFHDANNQLLNYEHTTSQHSLGKISDKNSHSVLSQTLANYQPSISDQVTVGFFATDRYCQTEESDILPLTEAIHNLVYLNKEMDAVKYDLKFAKNSTQSRFDKELSEKSHEIFAYIQKEVNKLKHEQEENLKRVRRAYNTKLSNAVIKISASFENEYSSKKAMSAENRGNLNQSYILKIRDLERTVAELEYGVTEAKRVAEENLKLMHPDIEAQHQKSLDNLQQERNQAYEEVTALTKKIEKLEETSMLKDEETEHLNDDIAKLEAENKKEKEEYDELLKEFEEFKKASELDKKKIKAEFDKQKAALETKMHEKLKESREQIVNAAKQELQQQKANQELDKQRLLEEKKRLLEEQEKDRKRMLEEQKRNEERLLQEAEEKQKSLLEREQLKLAKEKSEYERKERERLEKMNKEKSLGEENLRKSLQEKEEMMASKLAEKERAEREAMEKMEHERTELMRLKQSANNSRSEDLEIIARLKTNEHMLRSDVLRLNREIAKTNETWERKFDILKQNLHSIKDEMYLRQHLQKSSVNLAIASIAYTMDQPPSFRDKTFRQDGAQSHKNILPSIGSTRTSNDNRPISVAGSHPSRLSAHFEKDENQIVGDEEMKEFKDEYMKDIEFIPARIEH